MTQPDSPSEIPAEPLSAATPAPDTKSFADEVRDLLAGEVIQDPVDRRRIAETIAFLDATSERSVKEIVARAESIGEVEAGYDMQGLDAPEIVVELNRRMQQLQCQSHISATREELEKEPKDAQKIRYSLRFALDTASSYSKAYGNGALLDEALELKGQVDRL